MSLTIEELTPKQIVAELSKYIVGQNDAKKSVAVALRNRYRRQRLPQEQRDDIIPKNILMIGPTGVGKTEIARRLAQLAKAPFVKVEATKFTEVGYVGRDVDSIIRDLMNVSIRLVESEKIEEVKPKAEKQALERIVDMLVKPPRNEQSSVKFPEEFVHAFESFTGISSRPKPDETKDEQQEMEDSQKAEEAYQRQRNKVLEQIKSSVRDNELIEIEVEEA